MQKKATEEQLCLSAIEGCETSLGELLLNHYERLHRHLSARMPSTLQRVTQADDILQETFSVAFRDVERFEYRGGSSFYAWLKTIAEHRLQDAIKSSSRKKRGGDRVQVEVLGGNSNQSALDLFDMLSGSDGTASQSISRREAIQALQIAVAGLPDDYREVIRLRFFERRSVEETAAALDRTPAAIRSIADRAKKKLRESLGRLSHYMSVR